MKELQKLQKKQQGFTLLESLLALFILSIGLLGVAGMQAQAMKSGFVASQNMAVVLKGEELIERIRANPMGLDSYDGGVGASNGCTSGSVCSPAAMAADDLYIWNTEITNMFTTSATTSVQVVNVEAALDPNSDLREVTINIGWTSKNINYNYTAVAEVFLPKAP